MNIGSKKDSGGDYTYILDSGRCIDASFFPRCYMAMINDSIGTIHYPNCIFQEKKGKVFVKTLTKIIPNQELFIPYGVDFWFNSFRGDINTAIKNTQKKMLKCNSKIFEILKKEQELFNKLLIKNGY